MNVKLGECMVASWGEMQINLFALMSDAQKMVVDAFVKGNLMVDDFVALAVTTGFNNADAVSCLVNNFTPGV